MSNNGFRSNGLRLVALAVAALSVSANAADKKKPHTKPLRPAEILSRISPALVKIDCVGQDRKITPAGSGFLISDRGQILTDLHVLYPCYSVQVRLANGDVYDSVSFMDADVRKDIALIRIKAVSTPYLTLGDSNDAEAGRPAFAILNTASNSIEQMTIGGLRQMNGYKLVEMSAPSGPPDSGAPVLDDRGSVIAIAARKIENSPNQAVAIPINYAKGYLDDKAEYAFIPTFEALRKQGAGAKPPAQPVGGVVNSVPSAAPPPPPPPSAGARTPGRLTIGGSVQQAKLIRQVRPVYPPLAKQARVSGVVGLDAIIAKDGTILELTAVPGANPLLVAAAIEAVKQWVYAPTLVNGQPVEVKTRIDVNFTLNPGYPPERLDTAPAEGAEAPAIDTSADRLIEFLRGRIGVWDLPNARNALGDSGVTGPFQTPEGYTSYEFPQTGSAFRSVLLRFGPNQTLVNIVMYPAGKVAWTREEALMRQKFPAENPAPVDAAGAAAYDFPRSRTNFVVRSDGTVAYLIVY